MYVFEQIITICVYNVLLSSLECILLNVLPIRSFELGKVPSFVIFDGSNEDRCVLYVKNDELGTCFLG